jgi:hypothetical protein
MNPDQLVLSTECPDFTPSVDVMDALAQTVLGGGAAMPRATNGYSHRISAMLADPNGGFKDKSKYPQDC